MAEKNKFRRKISKSVVRRKNDDKASETAVIGKNGLPETDKVKRIKIQVIGIGNGGGSIVSGIVSDVKRVSFLVTNTDGKALEKTAKNVLPFQFGEGITSGLGTGMKPELGEKAAAEAKDKIAKILKDTDLCVFVATLGGGTGSGAAPVFAEISKNLGNINYGIFTLPFGFEGKAKYEIARNSLEKLRQNLNAISIIENERIFQIIDRKIPLKSALAHLNKILAEGLQGLIEIIYEPGLINIDFADVRTIFKGLGKLAYLNSIESGGENRAKEVISKVLSSPLYSYGAEGSKGILFNIAGDKNLGLAEVADVSKNIFERGERGSKIIFGISDNGGRQGKIKVTVLATGCRSEIFSEEFFKKPTAPKKTKRKVQRVQKIKISVQEKEISGQTGNSASLQQDSTTRGEQVRKNALQIKKEVEDAEKEILKKEKLWETPPFLRQNNG